MAISISVGVRPRVYQRIGEEESGRQKLRRSVALETHTHSLTLRCE